jgi:hypothetical protein
VSKQQNKIKEDLSEEELLRLRQERKEWERKDREQDQLKRYGVVTYRKQPNGYRDESLILFINNWFSHHILNLPCLTQ